MEFLQGYVFKELELNGFIVKKVVGLPCHHRISIAFASNIFIHKFKMMTMSNCLLEGILSFSCINVY